MSGIVFDETCAPGVPIWALAIGPAEDGVERGRQVRAAVEALIDQILIHPSEHVLKLIRDDNLVLALGHWHVPPG